MHSPRSRIRLTGQGGAPKVFGVEPCYLVFEAPRAVGGEETSVLAKRSPELSSTSVFESRLGWRCGAGEASDRSWASWAARAGAGQWMPSFPLVGAGYDAPPQLSTTTCVAVARRSWIAPYSRGPTFSYLCRCYPHALSPTTVRLLARSLKVDRTKSFVPGWRFGTPRKGWVLLTSVTQTESCRTRLRLSLLQPFAGVARSPFVEAGGFPQESMSP